MVRATDLVIETDVFSADLFSSSDFAHVNPDDLISEDFLLHNTGSWDTPPESPDCSSSSSVSEYELDDVLLSSCIEFEDGILPIKSEKPSQECPIKPIKGQPVMWNLSSTNSTAPTTVVTTKLQQPQPEQKGMITPPSSPVPFEDLDCLANDLWNSDDLLLAVGISEQELFDLDDMQTGHKRKAARLDDSIESKKARARQTRDEITMRTQAALSANKTETPELKRITHNVLERKRRNDLKLSYQELREQIPELKHVERAPTGQILLKAVEFVEHLKKAEQQLLHSIALAKAENEKLKADLSSN